MRFVSRVGLKRIHYYLCVTVEVRGTKRDRIPQGEELEPAFLQLRKIGYDIMCQIYPVQWCLVCGQEASESDVL